MNNLTVSIMGWYGNRNAGDEAVLAGILQHVRKISPLATINVFSNRPEETSQLHKVNGLYELPSSLWQALKTPYFWGFRRAYLPGIKVLRKTDLCIIGGGGIIADHNPQLIDAWCRKIKIALSTSKKVCLYGIGVEPLIYKSSVRKITNLFNRLDLITVRDNESKQILLDAGIENVVVAADPAFSLVQDTTLDASDIDLGFKNNVVLCPVHRFKDEDEKKYGLMHREFVSELAKKHPEIKVSVGLMFPKDSFITNYIKDISNFDKEIKLFDQHPNKIVKMFSQANAIVSTRLHGGILGALAQVPICPIVYDIKVMSFAKLLKLEDCVAEFGDGITWSKKQNSGLHLFDCYEKSISKGANHYQCHLNELISKSLQQANELEKITQ